MSTKSKYGFLKVQNYLMNSKKNLNYLTWIVGSNSSIFLHKAVIFHYIHNHFLSPIVSFSLVLGTFYNGRVYHQNSIIPNFHFTIAQSTLIHLCSLALTFLHFVWDTLISKFPDFCDTNFDNNCFVPPLIWI